MIDFLMTILAIDSTSGTEEKLADFIVANYQPAGAKIDLQKTANAKNNVFFQWGKPEIIFCTHLDTVPPYIAPHANEKTIYGRGSCDAKGQIAAMYQTCLQLHKEHQTNFGLLLTAGEEIDSYGAKAANELITGCQYVIVGEPTENKLIKAGKGTLQAAVTISGKTAHSGYPDLGENAINLMRHFLDQLDQINFDEDELLGKTTYNIGLLSAPNAHNVVADLVSFRLLFRTTFKTHNIIEEKISSILNKNIEIIFQKGAPPIQFHTVNGFATEVVAYGSDAPYLTKLGKPLLYGPGSILNAHTEHEQINIAELTQAVTDLKKIYYKIIQAKT
jgi:acetylornithine deacetylase